jgi:hypothetical protein
MGVNRWEDTPANVPNSKNAQHHPTAALRMLVEHIFYRLRVIDRTQVYLVNQVEKVPEEISIIAQERVEMEAKGRALYRQWMLACENADDEEAERPSQEININIGKSRTPPGESSVTTTDAAGKARRVAIMLVGTFWGIYEGLKALHIIK